jgi:uncharacterized Zn finger protein (UPF0148 family)
MPQYTCPSCKTVLKRDQPLPAGKKLKCPRCETIFGPSATASKPKKDDDEDRNPYAVQIDKDDDERMKAEKERAAQGLVKDRFKKSKRGPAGKEVVRPSNFLLASGVFNCAVALIAFAIGGGTLVFWDFFYTEGSSKPPPGVKYSDWEAKRKAGEVKMTDEERTEKIIERSIIMGVATFVFIMGSLICVGAFKMRTLESRAWAIAGSIISIVCGFLLIQLLIGIWCLVVLNNDLVKDGFEEEPPPEV